MSNDAEQLRACYEPKEIGQITLDCQVHAARFSPCGNFLAAGGFAGEVFRWDISSEEPESLEPLNGHHGWVQFVAFQQPGELLFSADSWGQLSAWAYAENKPQPKWTVGQAHDGWVRDVQVSPDGRVLATCGRDGMIRLWSADAGNLVKEFSGGGQDVFCLRFNPDGTSLLSGDDRGIVRQWNLESGDCERQFDASTLHLLHRLQDVGGVRAMNLDAAGKTLAVAGTKPKNGATVQGTPTVLLFDFETGELKQTVELGPTNQCYVHDVHLHEAGFLLAVTNGTPGTCQFLFQRPEDETPFFVNTKLANCHGLSFHPDGRRLAVTCTNRGSNGNGRRLNKDGEYEGNFSPIHLFEIPEAS